MSVGSSNLTGIPNRVAPPPVKQTQSANQQNTQVNQSARQAAISQANTPTNPRAAVAVSTAVSAPGSPAITNAGGTTAPSGSRPAAAQTGSIAQANTQAQSVAMSAFAPFLALAGAAALGATKTKISRVSGDEKEDTGDVELETEAELQPDALQESDQEQGAGEITEAGSTSGPST